MQNSYSSIQDRVVVIEPKNRSINISFWEFKKYLDLLYFFVWRDLKIRYKQTIIGIGWAVIQPLFTMIVFSVFFGKLAKIPSEGIAYPLFSFIALVPWTFFSQGVSQATYSLVRNNQLLKKIYFPRLILPISAVLVSIIDFFFAFVLLLFFMLLGYQVVPKFNILFLPFFLFLAFIISLGIGIIFTAINVRFRDMRYVVPFLLQIWLLATPVVYPISLVPEKWRVLYSLNPMVGVVEGFRWALLGGDYVLNLGSVVISFIVGVTVLVFGIKYFRSIQDEFADII